MISSAISQSSIHIFSIPRKPIVWKPKFLPVQYSILVQMSASAKHWEFKLRTAVDFDHVRELWVSYIVFDEVMYCQCLSALSPEWAAFLYHTNHVVGSPFTPATVFGQFLA